METWLDLSVFMSLTSAPGECGRIPLCRAESRCYLRAIKPIRGSFRFGSPPCETRRGSRIRKRRDLITSHWILHGDELCFLYTIHRLTSMYSVIGNPEYNNSLSIMSRHSTLLSIVLYSIRDMMIQSSKFSSTLKICRGP
jgi:hypothetical protein